MNYCLFWSLREESACGKTGIVRPVSASPLRLHLWDLRQCSLPRGPLCVLCKMGDWNQLSLCDVQAPEALLHVLLLVIYVCWNRETTNILYRHPSPAWETRQFPMCYRCVSANVDHGKSHWLNALNLPNTTVSIFSHFNFISPQWGRYRQHLQFSGTWDSERFNNQSEVPWKPDLVLGRSFSTVL